MIDQEKAIETIIKFLEDETKQTLLVKGYDNDAKVRVILSCLNSEFNKGIIRTSSMADIPFFINSSFNKKFLPNNVKSTENYKIGSITVNINSYTNNTQNNPRGNQDTFTWFHPVQLVLNDSKRYKSFLDDLEKTNSRKVILSTTNEWSIKNWDIENHVDEVFFYDVENDNPEIMRNLRNNGAI